MTRGGVRGLLRLSADWGGKSALKGEKFRGGCVGEDVWVVASSTTGGGDRVERWVGSVWSWDG